MPDVILSTIGGAGSQFFDNNGNVLSGGLLYTYAGGTTTPAATYTDSTGATAHANPVVLDSAGRVPSNGVWLKYGVQYKFVLKTADDVTLGTWDQFPGSVISDAVDSANSNAAAAVAAIDAIADCFVRVERITTNQVISPSAYTKLEYNSEVTDIGGDFNTTTYEFTAPATGTYLVAAGGSLGPSSGVPNNGNSGAMALYKNGSLYQAWDFIEVLDNALQTDYFMKNSIAIHLTIGDTIAMYGRCFSSVDWALETDGYLSITRIS